MFRFKLNDDDTKPQTNIQKAKFNLNCLNVYTTFFHIIKSSLVSKLFNICLAYSYSLKHTEVLSKPAVVIIKVSGCLLAPMPDSSTFKSSLSG